MTVLEPCTQDRVDHPGDGFLVGLRGCGSEAFELLAEAVDDDLKIIEGRTALLLQLLICWNAKLTLLQHTGNQGIDDLIMKAHSCQIICHGGSLTEGHAALQNADPVEQLLISQHIFIAELSHLNLRDDLLLGLVILVQNGSHSK